MNIEYSHDKETQFDFLCLYVRNPELVHDIIQPMYFNNPIHLDIARVVAENREKHPHDHIRRHILHDL